MKTWAHCVRDARLIYLHRDRFAYLFGANGECPQTYAEARALVESLWAAYPEHFQKYVIEAGRTKNQLIYHVIGKICYDCSSFICAVTQSEGDIYHLRVQRDLNSTMLRQSFTKATTLAAGLWGQILWKQGHVGLDVGNGLAIDFAAEFVDCREYRFVDPDSPTKFTDSGKVGWVDYTGSIAA